MKVSVALATYNGEKYICQQLDSLLVQTLIPDEVIIVDDGSSDRTPILVKEFIQDNGLQEKWHLYRNERNRGVKQSFLDAVSNATGDLIFLCDQDDIWMNEKISQMTNCIEKNKKIKVLLASEVLIDGYGNVISQNKKFRLMNNGRIHKGFVRHLNRSRLFKLNKRDFLHRRIGLGCTTVIRKTVAQSFIERYRACIIYDQKNTPLHDKAIFYLGGSLNGLYYLDIPVIFYRKHESNYTLINKFISSGRNGYLDNIYQNYKKFELLALFLKGIKFQKECDYISNAYLSRYKFVKNSEINELWHSIKYIQYVNLRFVFHLVRDVFQTILRVSK